MRTLIASSLLLVSGFLFLGRPGSSDGVEAGTALRMDIDDLVEHAALIVEGHVLSAHSVRTDDGRIETQYYLEVERTFEGVDEVHRMITLPGGVLEDGSGMILAGMPAIAAGEHVLLFLTEEASSGIRMPVGLAQGKFVVVDHTEGGKALVRNDGGMGLLNPETGKVGHGGGVAIIDYAEVTAEIEAALATKRAR